MDRKEENVPSREAAPVKVDRPEVDGHEREGLEVEPGDERGRERKPEVNPPHTTKHGITSPKFGSAGSGGAEYEGGFPRD